MLESFMGCNAKDTIWGMAKQCGELNYTRKVEQFGIGN
jgi:hypothetical protein